MADASDGGRDERPPERERPADSEDGGGADPPVDVDELERKYDFEEFAPADMAEMTLEEWEAAFDPETWITGPALVDRVEADLRSRVERRRLFAVVERFEAEGEERLVAYTDAGYAIVRPDGTVEGEGTIRGEVEPVVALCSMDDYEPPDPPEGAVLPHPDEVDEGTGELGDRLVQVVAGVQLLAGAVLLVSPLAVDLGAGGALLTTVAGLGFVAIAVVLFVLVANARLSDRFRAEEYRERLRAAGVGSPGRPGFLPPLGDDDGDG